MKNILFFAIAFFAIQSISAQDSLEVLKKNINNTAGVEVKPQYPGGVEKFYKFVARKYRVPRVKGLSGKVIVTFIIEMDGSLGNIKIIKDLGYGTGEEAVRVLKKSPKWTPGEQDGRKVRVLYAMPIQIESYK